MQLTCEKWELFNQWSHHRVRFEEQAVVPFSDNLEPYTKTCKEMTVACLRTIIPVLHIKPQLISLVSKPKTKTQQSCSVFVSSVVMSYDKELAAAKKAAALAARLCQALTLTLTLTLLSFYFPVVEFEQ